MAHVLLETFMKYFL